MFDYLIEKIDSAEFLEKPFRHLYIENFFNDDDFNEIIQAPEVNIKKVQSDDELFDKLNSLNYKAIKFPGCITDEGYYLKWREDKVNTKSKNQTSCEGFGMTYRLYSSITPKVQSLMAFLESEKFISALINKFSITDEYIVDSGIQKYLDGYEISPHPDIRRKLLTYMVNINPSESSDLQKHHTNYMTFNKQHDFIRYFWSGNEQVERCWVPWSWCDTQKTQSRNNSIVIFAPSNDTLHSVKADYDHLEYQRTQLYGNLWMKDEIPKHAFNWERFQSLLDDVPSSNLMKSLKDSALLSPIKESVKKIARRKDNSGARNIFK